MFSADLSTRERDGYIIVTLGGELDIADAVSVAAALAALAARNLEIIVDLAGLDFIDSSGVAALARGHRHARHAGSDLLLAAPQQQVLRVLTLTHLIEVVPIHASVDEATGHARHTPRPGTPAGGQSSGRPAQLSSPRHDLARSSMSIPRNDNYREAAEHRTADGAKAGILRARPAAARRGPGAWGLPAARHVASHQTCPAGAANDLTSRPIAISGP